MRDLALAFDIDVPKDCTKPDILPFMIEAEQQGVFQTEPKRPEFLVKASRSPDDPPVDWQSHRAEEFDLNSLRDLRIICKKHNETAPEDEKINSFHMSVEALKAALQEKGVL